MSMPPAALEHTAEVDETVAWNVILALRRHVARDGALGGRVGLRLDATGEVETTEPARGWVVAEPWLPSGWSWSGAPQPRTPAVLAAERLLDLYMPLCASSQAADLVVAHLAQSLDGRVATECGASQFISDRPDVVHTHRMRALCDAVLVGACTIALDDPQLTTRHVSGGNPVRVVVDPSGRLDGRYRVFRDGQAPTIVIRGSEAPALESPQTRVVKVPVRDGIVDADVLLGALRDCGLRRIFVEGGGITVSHFLQSGALHRLHVTVAPVIIGSGRPGLTLPVIDDLADALRLRCRHHVLGKDVLFDCVLREDGEGAQPRRMAPA